jgi:hypothetical protein
LGPFCFCGLWVYFNRKAREEASHFNGKKDGMRKSIVGRVCVLFFLPCAAQAEEEEPQGFTIPLEVKEESSSVLDRHLKGEWGFSNESRGDTIGGCSSCGG